MNPTDLPDFTIPHHIRHNQAQSGTIRHNQTQSDIMQDLLHSLKQQRVDKIKEKEDIQTYICNNRERIKSEIDVKIAGQLALRSSLFGFNQIQPAVVAFYCEQVKLGIRDEELSLSAAAKHAELTALANLQAKRIKSIEAEIAKLVQDKHWIGERDESRVNRELSALNFRIITIEQELQKITDDVVEKETTRLRKLRDISLLRQVLQKSMADHGIAVIANIARFDRTAIYAAIDEYIHLDWRCVAFGSKFRTATKNKRVLVSEQFNSDLELFLTYECDLSMFDIYVDDCLLVSLDFSSHMIDCTPFDEEFGVGEFQRILTSVATNDMRKNDSDVSDDSDTSSSRSDQ